MASTTAQLQVIIRHELQDDDHTISEATPLAVLNMIYRRVVALLRPPEYYKEDRTITTTDGTTAYGWPSAHVFMDVISVEMEDPYNDKDDRPINPVATQLEWIREKRKAKSFPNVYRRVVGTDNSTNQIQFAPAPDTTGLYVRITGIAEPAALTDGASTGFITTLADHALALVYCADWKEARSFPQEAQTLLLRASEMLSTLAGREITPKEIQTGVIEEEEVDA